MRPNRLRLLASAVAIATMSTGAALMFASSASAATIDPTPVQLIAGANTGFANIYGVAVAADGTTYVANENDGTINVFAAGATGNATPIRSISGSNTDLSGTLTGIAVDASGNLWVTVYGTGSVLRFAAGANGNVAPDRDIMGATTTLSGPTGVAVDSSGKVYVADGTTKEVAVFAASANGDVAPSTVIAGAATGFDAPYGVAIGPTGKIIVSDYSAASIDTFAAGASGNVAPLTTISGADTGLSTSSWYAAVDSHGVIYAANYGASTVTVYPATANGDAAPTTIITGPNSNIDGPYPIAIGPQNRIYVGNFTGSSVAVFDPVLSAMSVSPASGSINGGNTVTIEGDGFVAGATVQFGGVAATDVHVVSATRLTAVVPAHAKGVVDVTVTDSGDTSTITAGYRYLPLLASTGVNPMPSMDLGLGLLFAGALVFVGLIVARRRSEASVSR